jgi:hypothetical protein
MGNRSWAVANKDTVVRYVRALSSAFKFIRDLAKRIDVLKTIVEATGFAEANAQLTLALYLQPDRGVLPKLGEINLNGMEQAITLMGESGMIKAPPACGREVRRSAVPTRGWSSINGTVMKAFRDNRWSGADTLMTNVVAGLSDDTVAALPHRDLVLDRLASRCATIGLVTSPGGRGEAGSARPSASSLCRLR